MEIQQPKNVHVYLLYNLFVYLLLLYCGKNEWYKNKKELHVDPIVEFYTRNFLYNKANFLVIICIVFIFLFHILFF